MGNYAAWLTQCVLVGKGKVTYKQERQARNKNERRPSPVVLCNAMDYGGGAHRESDRNKTEFGLRGTDETESHNGK